MSIEDEFMRARANLGNIRSSSSRATTGPADPIAVDTRGVEKVAPDGYREMGGFERFIKGVGDVGETIYGLSGFSENWDKLKKDASEGNFTFDQLMKTLGSFGLSLPLGIVSAPFSAAEKAYEFATGTPTQEAIDDTWIPDYTMDWGQRGAAGLDAAIDIAGTFFGGGTGKAVVGGAKTLLGRPVKEAFKGIIRPGEKAVVAAKETLDNLRLAGGTADEIAKATKAWKSARRKSNILTAGYDMTEEGVEEAAQSVLEDIRGTKDQHGVDEISVSKMIESGILGALGGLVFSGFASAAHNIVEDTHDKAISQLVAQRQIDTSWIKDVPESEDILPTVREEISKLQAQYKVDPDSGIAVGQMWNPPAGELPNAVSFPIVQLIFSYEKEGQNGILHRIFKDFKYTVGGQDVGLIQAFESIGASARQQANGNAEQFYEIASKQFTDLANSLTTYMKTNGKVLNVGIGKNPGGKVAYVGGYVAQINAGGSILMTNALDSSINADIDGDNYTYIFTDENGLREDGTRLPVGSVWESFGQAVDGSLKKDPIAWDKVKIILGLRGDIRSKADVAKALYQDLTDDAKAIIDKDSFEFMVETIYLANSTPKSDPSIKQAIKDLSDLQSSPFNSIPTMLAWLHNNLAADADAKTNEVYQSVTSYDPSEVTRADLVAAVEMATGGDMVDSAIIAAFDKTETVRDKEKIKGVPTPGFIDQKSAVNRVIQMFGVTRNAFDSDTRQNLTFYQMVKDYSEHAYRILANTVADTNELLAKMVESVFSKLIRYDMDLIARGEHPMTLPTAMARKYAYAAAMVEDSARTKFKDYHDVMMFCESHLAESWDKEKKIWDDSRKSAYGTYEIEALDADLFPAWNRDDAIYNFYQCVADVSPSSLISGGTLTSSFEYYVAAAVKSDSIEFMQDATEAERTLILEIKNAINKKSKVANANNKKTIRQHLSNLGVKEDLDEVKAKGYKLDEIKDAGLYGFIRAHIAWIGGITRSRDLISSGLGSVERILAAAASPNNNIINKIARGLLSTDPATVVNAVATLSHYVVWMDPKAKLNKKTGRLGGFSYEGSVYTDVFKLASMDPKTATVDDISSAVENILYGLTRIMANSRLFSRVALHYGALLTRVINSKEDINKQEIVIGIAKDFDKMLKLFMDPDKSIDLKEKYAGSVLAFGEDYDTFFIDTITKEMDVEDMSTPSSRLSAVAPYAKNAEMLTREYVKAQSEEFIKGLEDPATPDSKIIMERVGTLHELEAIAAQQDIMVACADNVQRFMITRARKTQSTGSSGLSWDSLSRATIGFVPSETNNIAFAGRAINWYSIEESPTLLGLMAFTNYIKDKFGESGCKIVFPDGGFVIVKSKWDVLRMFMSEEDGRTYLDPREDESAYGNNWTQIVKCILKQTPAFVNIINPPVYSAITLQDGTKTETPAHKWRIGGYERNVQDIESPDKKRGSYQSLIDVVNQSDFEAIAEQEKVNSTISNILFSDREGMLLYTAAFDDKFFDNDHSYNDVAAESYRANKILTTAAKGMITGTEEDRIAIKNGLLYGSLKQHYGNARRSGDANRFEQFIRLRRAQMISDIDQTEQDFLLDLLLGESGILISGEIDETNIEGLTDQISENIIRDSEAYFNDWKEHIVSKTDYIEAMLGIAAIADLDIQWGNSSSLVHGFDREANRTAIIISKIQQTIAGLTAKRDSEQARLDGLKQGKKGSNKRQIEELEQSVKELNARIEKASFLERMLDAEQISRGRGTFADIKMGMNIDQVRDAAEDDTLWSTAVPEMIQEIEARRGKTVRTAADIMAGRDKPFRDDFAEAYAELSKGEKDVSKRREFIRKLLVAFVYSRGENIDSTAELKDALDSFEDAVIKALPGNYSSSQYLDEADRALLTKIKRGEVSLAISSDSHLQFANMFINEQMSGNAGYGVSINARDRAFFMPLLDIPATIELGGEADFTDTIWSPAYWDGKTKGDVYAEFAKLKGNDRDLFVGTYYDATRKKYVQLTELTINNWVNSQEPLTGRLYLLGGYNAGFDHRYYNPDLTGNPNYRGYNLELGVILLQCAEAMNLKSKKKSDIFDLKMYALEDTDTRKSVGDAAVIDVSILGDKRKLADAINEFKIAYAMSLDLLYSTDKGHQEIGFSFPMWKMFVDHQVQKIVVTDNDSLKYYTFSIKDIIDGAIYDTNTVAGKRFAVVSALPNISAQIDVMTAQELGGAIQRGINKKRGSRPIRTDLDYKNPKRNADRALKKNQDFAKWAEDAVTLMRDEAPNYAAAAKQMRDRVGRIPFKQSQYMMIETSGLDSSFGSGSRQSSNKLFSSFGYWDANKVAKLHAEMQRDFDSSDFGKFAGSKAKSFVPKNAKFIPVKVFGGNNSAAANSKIKDVFERFGMPLEDGWENNIISDNQKTLQEMRFGIFVDSNASAQDIERACATSARTGLPVLFKEAKDANRVGPGREIPLADYTKRDAIQVAPGMYAYYFEPLHVPNRNSIRPPRYPIGSPFTLGISSPFLPPKDGGGIVWTGSNIISMVREKSDTITVSGDILTISEVRKLLQDNSMSSMPLGTRLTQQQLADLKIVLPASVKRQQKETGPDIAFVGPVANYLAAISNSGNLKDDASIQLDMGGGLICIGLYKEDGYLKPIIIGPISQFDNLYINWGGKDSPRTINWSTQANTEGSLDRGETQKIYIQMGGIKLEVNKPNKITGEPNYADIHQLFGNIPSDERYTIPFTTVFYDSGNNGNKQPNDRSTFFSLIYYWIKNVDNAYSLFFYPDGRVRAEITGKTMTKEQLEDMLKDESKNDELCNAILTEQIAFSFFDQSSTNYSQFIRSIKEFANQSLATGIPLVEMLGNFTVNKDNAVLSYPTIPDALTIMPKRLTQQDLAVVFNAMSDKLLTLDPKANPGLTAARFTADGKILTFINGVGDYLPACIYETSMDSRNSSLDNFLNTAKLGEKPQTLLAFFNGVDPYANNDQLRIEAALATSTNLDEIDAFYRQHSVNIGNNWVKSGSEYDKMRRRAAIANMEPLFNENEQTDLDNWVEATHRADISYIYQKFGTSDIYMYDGDKRVGIYEKNQQLLDYVSQAWAMFDDSNADQNHGETEFRKWYASLLKRYLAFTPAKKDQYDVKDTFTEAEINEAALKINNALRNGRIFYFSGGEINFVSTRSGGENRYIVPVLMRQDAGWLALMKGNSNPSFTDQIDETTNYCNSLLEQLNNGDESDVKKRALFNMVEALSTNCPGYKSGKIHLHYAKSAEYLPLIIKDNEELVVGLYGSENAFGVMEIGRQNAALIQSRLDSQLQRNKRVVKSPFWAKGGKTFEVVPRNESYVKVLNGMVEFNKIAKVCEPMLWPAGATERSVFGGFQMFGLLNGMLGRCISPYRSNLITILGKDNTKRTVDVIHRLSADNDLKMVFNDFRILTLNGTTDFMVDTVAENIGDVKKYLSDKRKEKTKLEKWSDTAFDWASAKGFNTKLQVRIFFSDLIRLISLDPTLSAYWLAPVPATDLGLNGTITRFEHELLQDPQKFFLKCFQSNSSLLMPAKQAYNVAMQGDAAAKTVQSIIFYETCAQHPVFRALNSIFFSPFVQYGFNIVNRHLQAIAPVSTINYMLVTLGAKSDLRIPWLHGKNGEKLMLKDLNLEDAQVASCLKEAMQIDLARFGVMGVAMLLASITGALEPPEDEDKWGNIDEWTIFGCRVKANWWLQDIIGPSLGYAAALVAAWKGKPCPEVFTNNLAECLFADPLMRVSDAINWIFNPWGQYMEGYYNDIDRFSETVDGQPTAAQVLGADFGMTMLSTLFGFITPSVLKDIYRETQQYEVSYKNVYKTDAYGNVLRDENGNPVGVEKATYLDQKIRQQCKNNPTFALFMEAIRMLGGGGGTSYWANSMPRTIYYDPYQLDSYKSLSLYTVDEKGNVVLKPEQEQQAIAYYCLTQLLQYDNMDDLVATGFCMPIETMRLVDDVLWDTYWYQQEIWNEWESTGQLDPTYLGAGDYELGKQTLEALKSEYDSLYDFWADVHYNKLWSDQMKAGIQRYNRLATSYAQDANGEWFATGFRRGLPNLIYPFVFADGTVSDPGPTMGWENDWSSPSAVTGMPLDERVLVPFDDGKVPTPKFESLADSASGNGYSSSYQKYMKPYTTTSRSGGGYSRRGYVQAPKIYNPSIPGTRYMEGPGRVGSTFRPISNVDLDAFYIRPGFETKGSRKAYRREDI